MDNTELKPRRWLLVVLLIIAIAIVVVLLNKVITDHNERKENGDSNGISDIIDDDRIDDQRELVDNMFDKFEIDSFNSTFEFRVGENYGSTVKRALDDVITNNKKNSEHIVTVVYEEISTSDPEEIKNTKQNFDDWTKYEISVDYDDNGYVNKITIEK